MPSAHCCDNETLSTRHSLAACPPAAVYAGLHLRHSEVTTDHRKRDESGNTPATLADKPMRVIVMWTQGVEPEARTFNTIIIACNLCGQPLQALEVSRSALYPLIIRFTSS